MSRLSSLSLFLFISIIFSSCEFRCSVGDADSPKAKAEVKDGARVYNEIQLETKDVKLSKAYLVLDNGEPVPETNIIDFSQPVHLKLFIEEGWTNNNDKVQLGASEKIRVENGEVLLDEKDLFSKYPDGISEADAKQIRITATILAKKKMAPLTVFTVEFRVWDKNSEKFIQGSYKLYSK